MSQGDAAVLRFPLKARMRVRAIVERCPALGAVADRLPPEGDGARCAHERVLAQAFTLLLHLPEVSREEADVALGHEASAEDVTVEELARLHEGNAELYEIWRCVWAEEADEALRAFGRYCVALIARLYRLEPHIRRERLAEAAIA
ncbi:MAG TPA: hypothetical protein VL426_06815 [Candidatus Binatia bacterium]|nr:hypothetical protein [Candidatus Binatia bacterium]